VTAHWERHVSVDLDGLSASLEIQMATDTARDWRGSVVYLLGSGLVAGDGGESYRVGAVAGLCGPYRVHRCAGASDPVGMAPGLASVGVRVGGSLCIDGDCSAWRDCCGPAAAESVGWLLLLTGFSMVAESMFRAYAVFALSRGLPGGVWAAWASSWGFVFIIFPLCFMFLLFPNGRLPSTRWRIVCWLVAGCATLIFLVAAFLPGPIGDYFPATPNPLGVPALSMLVDHMGAVSIVLILCPFLLAALSLLQRFRTCRGMQRQQLKWVAFAVLVDVALVMVTVVALTGVVESIVTSLAGVVLSLGVMVAVVRHGLFDIDRLLSRSLVYGGLTIIVSGLYLAVVSGLGLAIERSGVGAAVVASGLVAVAFQPARQRVQLLVDRLIYGERDNPHVVLARLGEQLEAAASMDKVLPSVVDTIARSLKLSYVGIELLRDGAAEPVASAGIPNGSVERLPLTHQRELLGHLVCAPRPWEDSFSAVDRRVLVDVARHAGGTVHSVRLARDLQRSHELQISAREEERRRLRRELHDGLGPTLAGMVLQLSAARTMLDREPDSLGPVLERLCDQAQHTLANIRRVAYELRPPALDELGLVRALREQVSRLTPNTGTRHDAEQLDRPAGLDVCIHTPSGQSADVAE
jgi:two-component system NarL family sensor kinase